ncbi:PAS domain S-box-containing protein [Frateuria terrea]|uniref:histidine kinase n=2 Tax=Frateuria terrea TaxID=529704 RepID=A0A1H6RDX1_9GAMM|nr:ATP-binding protein [Frateuria terrea]SEI51444.1 PAS domain S-box-containing protein [Frateuria terrea]SFP16324.1 PAS domain S-box-containing protein [Frateuria terrea]
MPIRHRALLPELRRGLHRWRVPRWRMAGLLFAVVVIVLLPYLATRTSHDDAMEAAQLVTHSSEVKSLTYRIAYVTRSSEAAIYRLLEGDKDPSLVAKGRLAGNEVPALLGQLSDMTRDNATQQAAIGALGNVVNGRLALLEQALARIQHGDHAGAVAALHDAGTLFQMDQQIETVVRNEGTVLMERRAHARQSAFESGLVLAITSIAQVVLLAVIVLVSERQIARRMRAETRESQAVRRAQMIVQAVREPIALLNAQLCTLLVNTAFSELYGLPQEDQRELRALQEVGDGAWTDGALLQRLRDVLLHDRELWDYELVQRTVGGIDRHVMVNARRLQQHEGEPPVVLLTVSDVTARALVEQQVKELNRQLEGKVAQISDVNRELEAFSYSVSHDLRAPLRHIAGFTGKLKRHLEQHLDDTAAHYLEVIGTSATRMAQLIDDLLVFSRLGRGALRLQAVDMQSLVEEARALAESEAGERNIEWIVSPLPIVIGDENMLRTVWQNLIGNAVKYTGRREVAQIAVGVERDRDGEYVFTVADNGAGFNMEYAGKLFGVFQRLHRASEFPGNGIGLANVRRIVARHGGRVWAEAEPDRGASFHFSLPATELAEARTTRRSP